MPIRLESDLEKRVCQEAEAKGWKALKLVCVGHRGFPDRWFIRGIENEEDGITTPEIVIIEFKAPGKRARKLQEYVCDMLRTMGLNVFSTIDNYEEAKEILGL